MSGDSIVVNDDWLMIDKILHSSLVWTRPPYSYSYLLLSLESQSLKSFLVILVLKWPLTVSPCCAYKINQKPMAVQPPQIPKKTCSRGPQPTATAYTVLQVLQALGPLNLGLQGLRAGLQLCKKNEPVM